MLILPQSLAVPTKNPTWEHRTPNEAYQQDAQYQEMVDFFVQNGKVSNKPSFFEVRVLAKNSLLALNSDERWWNEPMFMEKIFWVFQQPVTFYPEGLQAWQAWVLEPLEHVRVFNAMKEKIGYNPYPTGTVLLLPCDCGEPAWNETSGGYSDHIHHRLHVPPTQEQVDAEAELRVETDRLMEQITEITTDIPDDPRYYQK